MTDDAALKPRKRPAQARSRATVAALLEAGAQVLERDGLDGFNTNRVAARAGVSVGSLYQYFPNKRALLVALIEQAQTELRDGFAAVATGGGLESDMRGLLAVAIRHQTARPMLARALDEAERRLPVDDELATSAATIRAAVLDLLLRHRDRLDPSDDVAQVATDLVLIGHALIDAVDDDIGLEARAMRALLGYLRPRAAR